MWRKSVESAAAGVQIGKTPEQPYSLIYSRASVKKAKHSPVRVDRATHHKNVVRHCKHIARHPNSLKLAWLFS
jgi:hypothetical protein